MKAPSNPSERQPLLSLLSSPRIFIWIDYRCSPLFGKCLSSFYLLRTLSPISCLYVYYRYIEPQSYTLSQNLSPLRHAFYVMNVQASFNFLLPVSHLNYLISLFLFFFPSLVPTACILLFFFLAFSHISYISCISPISFIGPRSSRLPRVLYFSHIVRR